MSSSEQKFSFFPVDLYSIYIRPQYVESIYRFNSQNSTQGFIVYGDMCVTIAIILDPFSLRIYFNELVFQK